ncbi:unnamed protein product, partial [marine sediment metagenome]
TLETNSVEIKWRSEKEAQLLPLEEITAKLKGLVSEALSKLSN